MGLEPTDDSPKTLKFQRFQFFGQVFWSSFARAVSKKVSIFASAARRSDPNVWVYTDFGTNEDFQPPRSCITFSEICREAMTEQFTWRRSWNDNSPRPARLQMAVHFSYIVLRLNGTRRPLFPDFSQFLYAGEQVINESI